MASDDLAIDLERRLSERREASRYLTEYETRVPRWRSWKRRVQEFDAICRGDFYLVFPDESALVERPKVPNIVQLGLESMVNTAISVPFTLRVDKVTEKAKEFAEKKERIAAYYLAKNRISLMQPLYYNDKLGAGVNFKLVLPDFKSGYPCIKRLNPRHVWPNGNYSPDRPIADVIVAYEESVDVLKGLYPDAAAELVWPKDDTKIIKIIEYYDKDEFLKVACTQAKNGKKRYVTLEEPIKNRLSRIPVVVSARPTHDEEFRGQFDQVIPVLNAENRTFNLVLDGALDWIASPIVEYGISNPQDYGKAILHAENPQAFMRRQTPEGPNPQIWNLHATMQGAARVAANYPEGRTGAVQQNIISAAGINALMGDYNATVAHVQQSEAASWEEALSLCYEVDEKYLGEEKKKIAGRAKGAAFSEHYTPAKDIDGDYDIRVEYGAAAGGDRMSYEIRLTQAKGNGGLSEETYMEKLDIVEDVQRERNRIFRERSLAGILALVDLQTQAGNPYPAIELARIIGENQDVMQNLERIANLVVPTQQQGGQGAGASPLGPGGPPTGTEAFTEASSIARGGVSPETNVPGVGSLPPLSDVLVPQGG